MAGLVQGQVFDMVISRETLRARRGEELRRSRVPFAPSRPTSRRADPWTQAGNLALSLRACRPRRADAGRDRRSLARRRRCVDEPAHRVAQQIGADVIIAVDVIAAPDSRDVEVGGRRDDGATNLLGRASLDEQLKLKPNDVLIVPSFAPSARSNSHACTRLSKRATTP
jgi:hypothetical protein